MFKKPLRVIFSSVTLVSLLLLEGCNVTLVQFKVPPAVRMGQVFEVLVLATGSNGAVGDSAGAVLQLPNGFTVLGSWGANGLSGAAATTTNAAFLGLYTPEPGHFLTEIVGSGNPLFNTNPKVLRVQIQAPPTPGQFTFKVALGAASSSGAWQAQDPSGATNFALITAPPNVQTISVNDTAIVPATAWHDESGGLPLYSFGKWSGLAFGDVNNDGLDDVACTALLGTPPQVFLRSPTGWTLASVGLSGNSGARNEVAFGDFDGNGFLDLAGGNGRAWLGNGGLSWTLSTTGMNLVGPMEGVAVGDVNGDNLDDVIFSAQFGPAIQAFLSNGNGTWTESSAGLPSAAAGSPASGGHKLLLHDMNGDGNLDIVWARFDGPSMWLGDGAGNWAELPNSGLGTASWFGLDAGDIDGDGDEDLLVGVFSTPNIGSPVGIRVYLQQPGLQWVLNTSSGLPTPMNNGYYDVALADFDRDTILDVVAGTGDANQGFHIEFWRGLGGGQFAAAPARWMPGVPPNWTGAPEALAVGDINADGFVDVGLASFQMGVEVLQNDMVGTSLALGGLPVVGSSFPVTLFNPVSGQGTFAAALALGTSPGIPVAGQVIPLNLDPLFQFSIIPGNPFLQGGFGAFNAMGEGSITVTTPPLPSLVGLTIYAGYVTFNPLAPGGLGVISPALPITLQ